MAAKVIMPKQGLQMTEGKILRWMKKEGDRVKEGQPLFEMETDKLTIEIEAPATGTLLKIVREVGETVPITELIAVIGEPGEDISGIVAGINTGADVPPAAQATSPGAQVRIDGAATPGTSGGKAGERIFITPRARMLAEEKGLDMNSMTGTGPEGLIIERDVAAYAESAANKAKATPVARKLAELSGIGISEVSGTGIGGKVMKSDVAEAIAMRGSGGRAAARKETLVPFTGMRKAISDRMMQSLHGMAQANHRMKVDMSEAVRFREKLKADGLKVTFTDILVKVVSKALLDFPVINSSLSDEGIVMKGYVNMGIAVAVDNGLIVPVIKDADLMCLEEISRVSAELIDRAKNGKLKPDDYTGGTFTITNLGMFDIDEFTAVINPPEAGILAIGKIDRIPVAEGENVVIKPVTTLSLTYDHRIVDGAPAAQFLRRIKQILQNPYLLV